MKYEPINGGFKKLTKDLSKMTFKEKLDHLWTYYKGSLVVLAIVIMLLSILFTTCRARNTHTILSGISINVMLSEEGQSYVKDQYYEKTKTKGLEQVVYTETLQEDFSTSSNVQENYMILMNLITICTEEELDYLFMDQIAIRNLVGHGVFLDLREFFTEEELDALGDNIIWMDSGTADESEYIPIAVKVEHIPFIAEHAMNNAETYFGIVNNTPRLEECRSFWEYINAWTPAN